MCFLLASLTIAMGVAPLNSFNIPRNVPAAPTLKKTWGSVGHLSDREVTEKVWLIVFVSKLIIIIEKE